MSPRLQRLPLLAAGILTLAYGVFVGLARLGLTLPLPQPTHLLLHGPLMVCGFLGAVIGLERAVALGRAWTYGAPVLAALGSLATLLGPANRLGPALVAAGSPSPLAMRASVPMEQGHTIMVPYLAEPDAKGAKKSFFL